MAPRPAWPSTVEPSTSRQTAIAIRLTQPPLLPRAYRMGRILHRVCRPFHSPRKAVPLDRVPVVAHGGNEDGNAIARLSPARRFPLVTPSRIQRNAFPHSTLYGSLTYCRAVS